MVGKGDGGEWGMVGGDDGEGNGGDACESEGVGRVDRP